MKFMEKIKTEHVGMFLAGVIILEVLTHHLLLAMLDVALACGIGFYIYKIRK